MTLRRGRWPSVAPALTFLACLLVLASAGCARHRAPLEILDSRQALALYKARLEQPDESGRRFRMLVFGVVPDRLHVEVLPPIGGTEMIVDAGGGRLAVTLVDERRAYVGLTSPQAVERMLGLELELETLLGLLLEGGQPTGDWSVVREPADRSGFPDRLEIGDGRRRLKLELKRMQPLGVDASTLGTGNPPQGMEILPLSDLPPFVSSEGVDR